MTVEEFWEVYLKNNGYETPGDFPRAWAGKWNAWYTTWLLCSICKCSWMMARTRELTPALWGARAFAIQCILEKCGANVVVEGVENLRKIDRPVVFVSNHMSMTETFLLPTFLLPFSMFTWVVKESLLHYPVFGATMRAMNPITVSRKDPREDLKQVMTQGLEILTKKEISLLIFPQATREAAFRPALFNTLGVKLARKAGVPVVPIALKTDFQGVGRVIRDFGPVDRSKTLHFRFGAPMEVEGTGREQHQATIDFIAESLREWGGTVVDGGNA